MAWVIFKPDDRLVEEAVPDAATALSRVALLGGTTRRIEVDDQQGGSTIPDWFFPGVYVDTAGVLYEEAPVVLTDVERLQAAARATHVQLLGWLAAVNALQPYYDADHINKARSWLAWAHYGVAHVCRSSTQWTIAQRIKFCEETAAGALDITTPYEFLNDAGATALAAPTSPVVWVNPATGAQVLLSGADTATNAASAMWDSTEVTAQDVDGAGWVDAISS